MVFLNRTKLEELCENNTKTTHEMVLKLTEEVGEVAQAVLSHEGAQGSMYKNKTRDDVVEELVDVMMVVESLLYHLHVSDNEFNSTFNRKLDKWEEKTK